MRVTAVTVREYALPLAAALPGAPEGRERRGLLLGLGTSDGTRALGECAPLAGFSEESLETAGRDLVRFARAVLGQSLPGGLEALDGGFQDWLGPAGYCPSARFAAESAVLGLVAAGRGVGLASLLVPAPPQRIPVSGLVDRRDADRVAAARRLAAAGYRTIKVKVGGGAPDQDGATVTAVRRALDTDIRLRVDANRAWSSSEARAFLDHLASPHVPGATIEYVEEPARDLESLRTLGTVPGIPLALDEGLRELEPEQLAGLPGIGAIVVKPSLLGLERAAAFARQARADGRGVVVSSSFESGVGIRILVHLAAAWSPPRTAAGLGTLGWLARDLVAAPASPDPATLPVAPCLVSEEALDPAFLGLLHTRATVQ